MSNFVEWGGSLYGAPVCDHQTCNDEGCPCQCHVAAKQLPPAASVRAEWLRRLLEFPTQPPSAAKSPPAPKTRQLVKNPKTGVYEEQK